MQSTPKIILGIDPGTVVMGYGIIQVLGNQVTLIDMGVLRLSSAQDPYERLQKIHQKVADIIRLHAPTSFAIEAPFFGKNVQSMLKLGRAQGVAIASAMQAGLSVCEYSPKRVKQSITGNGNAAKEQVMKMMMHLLKLQENPKYFDATDALAVAMCHHFETCNIVAVNNKKAKGWKDFIANNPEKLIRK